MLFPRQNAILKMFLKWQELPIVLGNVLDSLAVACAFVKINVGVKVHFLHMLLKKYDESIFL